MPDDATPPNGDRLQRILSVTDADLARLDVDALLEELLERVRALLGADTATILLFDDATDELVATVTKGLEEEVYQGVRIPLGRGFAGRIAAERRPVIIDDVETADVVNPILRMKGLRSLAGVPLLAAGSLIGALHVGTLKSRSFGDEDIGLLEIAAERAALGVQARYSETNRAAAVMLQRSLLPAQLPKLPGVELAARYVPSLGGIGGDWYDVFSLPNGWLGLAMGDVVGRGLRAASVMGRLRSALRAYALDLGDPAETLTKLDRLTHQFEPDLLATVAYAMVDPSVRQLHVSLAGHPPPVLATSRREGELMDIDGDLPLGVDATNPRRTTIFDLPADATVCLYTDGLIERRGSMLDVGLDQLCKAVRRAPADVVCADVMHALVGAEPTEDDIALLTLTVRRDRP